MSDPHESDLHRQYGSEIGERMVRTAILLLATALVASVLGYFEIFACVTDAARVVFFVAVLALVVTFVIGISKNPPP